MLHKSSRLSKLWQNFKDENSVLKSKESHIAPNCLEECVEFYGMKQHYDESNNMFVFFFREFTGSISHRLSSIFAETETAKAMREIALRDPTFNLETFMKDAHEFIIPEILDAIITADLNTLRIWCAESTFNMLKATFDAQLKVGQRMEGRVLDLRHIEVCTNSDAKCSYKFPLFGRWQQPSSSKTLQLSS